MKFVLYFYILIIFLIQRSWKILGSADFNTAELEHLSEKLHPTECMKLLESIYLRTPAYVVKDEKNENDSSIPPSQEDCRLKLEQWKRMFPGDKNEFAREHMAKSLIQIGRPDLANFIKRNKRLIQLLDNFIKPGDVYLYNKYLPRRYSEQTLVDLFDGKSDQSKTINTKKRHLNDVQLMADNSSFQYNLKKNPVKKEIMNLKNVKHIDGVASHNKLQAREATPAEDVAKKPTDIIPQTYWIIIIGVGIIVIVAVLIIIAMVYIYKSGNRVRDALMSKARCDPRCKGYERFPKDTESGFVTSSTEMSPRKWAHVSDSMMSGFSTPDRKYGKMDGRKARKEMEEKKKRLEKELQKIAEKDKKKKERQPSKERKRSESADELEPIIGEGMKMNINEIMHILRKDRPDCPCCSCDLVKDKGICMDDSCTKRRIKNLASLNVTRARKSSTSKRQRLSKKKDSKVRTKTDKAHRRKVSSTDTLIFGQGDPKLSSPRVCIRESTVGSPKKRSSLLKEKSPSKEKPLSAREKSPRKSSMEPCTDETCAMRTSPRHSVNSTMDINQGTKRKFMWGYGRE